jgi:hypothetical protein
MIRSATLLASIFALAACSGQSDDSYPVGTTAEAPGPMPIYDPEAERRARLAAQQAGYRLAIEDVLARDRAIGPVPNDTRVAIMRAIDLSRTPEDFRVAFVDHIHAWEGYARADRAIASLKQDEDLAAAAEVVSWIVGSQESPYLSYADAMNRLVAVRNQADTDVNATFQKVERLAARYNASITGQGSVSNAM